MLIPSELVAPIIKEYVASYDTSEMNASNEPPSGKLSPLAVLAEEAGMTPDTLYRHVAGKRSWLDREVVDRLLVKMGLVHLWFTSALSEFYSDPPEEQEKRKQKVERTHCPNGHPYTPENIRVAMGARGVPYKRCRKCGLEVDARRRAARPGIISC